MLTSSTQYVELTTFKYNLYYITFLVSNMLLVKFIEYKYTFA